MLAAAVRAVVRRLVHLEPESAPRRRYLPWGEARSRVKPGDVLLFEGRGVASAAIRWRTGSYRTHAGLVDVVETGGELGRRVLCLHSREWRGVLVEPVSTLLRRGERVAWFRHVGAAGVPADGDGGAWELPPVDRERIVAWAWDRVGDPYGWGAIARFARSLSPWALPLSPVDGAPLPRRLVCSAFVAGAVLAGGRDLVPNLAEVVTSPGELETSALLAYEGELVP